MLIGSVFTWSFTDHVVMRHGFCRASHLLWLWSCLLQILALITWRGWTAQLAAPSKFSVIYQENNNNNPQICVTYSRSANRIVMLCIRTFNDCALNPSTRLSNSYQTVWIVFGSYSNQKPSITFIQHLWDCLIWVFPSGITHVLSLL